ncbi:MAG TPA: hypothetical protein VK209_12510 [Candidatus Sulfotelmatobacter sp.]|nr:hypothetical protein [Candidatus Sulfotelmatobacter sp.]
MKRIIVLILGLVLLMLSAVAPAIAASATIVPVHGGSIAGGTSISPEMWLTNGYITQLRGGGSQGGKLGLYIYPSAEEPDYVLTINEEYDAMVNWKTGEGIWRFTETWEYLVDGQIAGTFKGEWLIKSTGAYITPSGYPVAWTHLEGHAVLQGGGIFDGQTLMMDSERTRGFPGTFEGFLLTS